MLRTAAPHCRLVCPHATRAVFGERPRGRLRHRVGPAHGCGPRQDLLPYLLTARKGVARDLKLPSHSYGCEGVVGYFEAKSLDLASYPPLPLIFRFLREVPPRFPSVPICQARFDVPSLPSADAGGSGCAPGLIAGCCGMGRWATCWASWIWWTCSPVRLTRSDPFPPSRASPSPFLPPRAPLSIPRVGRHAAFRWCRP